MSELDAELRQKAEKAAAKERWRLVADKAKRRREQGVAEIKPLPVLWAGERYAGEGAEIDKRVRSGKKRGARGGGNLPPPVMRARGPRPAPTEPYVVGIDTIGVSFPISGDFDIRGCTETVFNKAAEDESRRYLRKLEGGGSFGTMGLTARAGEAFGWFEASLPKRVGDDNVHALAVHDVAEQLALALQECQQFCDLRISGIDELRVKRLDLVRDFENVRRIPQLLDGLAGVRQAGRVKVNRFADAQSNRAETLLCGVSSAWRCRLYDKHAQTKGLAPEGRLRYEAQCRDELLVSKGAVEAAGGAVRVFADVVPGKVEKLGRWMFDRVGFGREVYAMDQLFDLVFDIEGLTKRERRELWAYVTTRPYGVDLGYSAPTLRKYDRICAEHRIVCSGRELKKGATARLDFDEGTEILRMAS